MDIQKEREAFEEAMLRMTDGSFNTTKNHLTGQYTFGVNQTFWAVWQAAKAQAVPAQLDVNSILHDIDCYFDNGLSNTERTANNLLQSIYEKLSGEVKAQEPAND